MSLPSHASEAPCILCDVKINLKERNHACVGLKGLETINNFSVKHNALISGHPGGVTPGTYGGIARDLLTFVANFWPRTGALDRFCTTAARYTGKDPQDL